MRNFAASLAVVLVCANVFALIAFAAELPNLTVSPVVVDEKAKARDILKQSISITNTSNQRLDLYPSVNDVHKEEGEQAFTSAQDASDRAASLANWIELSRGVLELSPGEEKIVPFVIRVNMNAIPGTYHANIALYQGSNREDAESREPLATIAVNLDVQEDVKEEMQLNSFFTDNVFFSGDDVLFNYQVENIGNKDIEPKGEIRIYDRRGKEVASLEVNRENKSLSPDQMTQLASVWSAASGFGKYKAFINIDYGASQKASVQDTVFFWIIPWQQLLILFTVSLALIIGGAIYFLRIFEARHHMAHAGASGLPSAPVAAAVALPPQALHADDALPRVSILSRTKKAFAFFKREARHASVLHASPDRRPKQSLREALGDKGEYTHAPVKAEVQTDLRTHAAPSQPSYGGTIDLKNMTHQKERPAASELGHVINLKNHK